METQTVPFILSETTYTNSGEFKFTELGTLSQLLAGKRIKFTAPNLKKVREGSVKRVNLIVITPDGSDKDRNLPLSEPLSKTVTAVLSKTDKTQEQVLSVISKLKIYRSVETGYHFVMSPNNNPLESYLIDELAKQPVTFEQLVW